MAVKDLVSGVLAESITTSTTNVLVTIAQSIGRPGILAFFPTPPFYITIMPKTPAVGVANRLDSEILQVTAVSNDQVGNAALTCVRGQRDTTAKAFSAGDIVTVGVYTDDAVLLGGTESTEPETPWIRVSDIIWSTMIDKIYPVGSIFMSATLSTAAAVGNALGGTWVKWGAGRVPVGVNTSDSSFNTVEKTGGSKYIQDHTHDIRWNERTGRRVLMSYNSGSVSAFDLSWQAINADTTDTSPINLMAGKIHDTSDNFGLMTTGNAGNLQPYITCYMYKRTA